MNKPYSSAPLSDHHLRLGLLVGFANEVNRGLEKKDMNPMGNLYVFDNKEEIRTPLAVPENWPSGLIRVYAEQVRVDRPAEFTLSNFDPAMLTTAYDAKRGGGMDQQGIRFTASTGYLGLQAHYLVVPEFSQLSFAPLIGHHLDTPEKILEESNLIPFDQKRILFAYEDAKLKEEYTSEEDIEHMAGVPFTYQNWIMLNAMIIAKVVTLRNIALAQYGEEVRQETIQRDDKTGAVLPIDVSQEEA